MADTKISALTAYTPPIDTDVIPIVDVTTSTTKKITIANLKAAMTGRLIGITLLTSASANFTTNALTKKILVIVQAAGGGGAGKPNSSSGQVAVGAGGGGGGWAIKLFDVAGSTAYAYTCGVAGTNNSGSNGGTGGDSTFTVGGVTVTAKGGVGGAGSGSGTTIGAADGALGGAVSTNGDVNVGGEPSENPIRLSSTAGTASCGGSSFFGAGGRGRNGHGNGYDATGYGAGGGGSNSINAAGATTGGAATPGCILVYEYT